MVLVIVFHVSFTAIAWSMILKMKSCELVLFLGGHGSLFLMVDINCVM